MLHSYSLLFLSMLFIKNRYITVTDSSGSCTWCNNSCINMSVLINGSKDMDMMNQALNNAKQCETIIYCINIYIIYIIF